MIKPCSHLGEHMPYKVWGKQEDQDTMRTYANSPHKYISYVSKTYSNEKGRGKKE